ncbi:MAG: prepilin-type N-terminal cleavage/methylation domain-containing protein [Phycisphaeraceae bacterium]|nr:prepilin-type N-terminal cleavage/methylation domain-containing protein [Phycisphaeraceae bacterium]
MRSTRDGFTLLELLVVVAIAAAVIGILFPLLASARAATRDVSCLSNLRSGAAAWRLYGIDNNGRSPALGVPWATEPNWAMVVQRYSDRASRSANEVTAARSVLVCASTQRRYPSVEMTRTYAANVTGFSGLEGDAGDFDAAPTFVRFERVRFPASSPMMLDSAPILPGPDLPPPTRTASVIDFRDPDHVAQRIGRVHSKGRDDGHFQVAFYDGSASRHDDVEDQWRLPLED